MKDARRAYDILRSYIGREFERIQKLEPVQNLERLLAEDELKSGGASPSAPAPEAAPVEAPKDPKVEARKVLGVAETASYREIRQAYTKLSKRSADASLQAGSTEAAQANLIQRRVQWAYQVLSADFPETDRRFGSLEIE